MSWHIHRYTWKRGVGHTRGSSLTGTCRKCSKTKFVKFVGWGERRQQRAEPHIPIVASDGPPPPPPRRQYCPRCSCCPCAGALHHEGECTDFCRPEAAPEDSYWAGRP